MASTQDHQQLKALCKLLPVPAPHAAILVSPCTQRSCVKAIIRTCSNAPDLTLSFCCVTVTEHGMFAVLVCELNYLPVMRAFEVNQIC